MSPELHTVPARWVLRIRRRTRLADLPRLGSELVPALCGAAQAAGLQFAGPNEFVYWDFQGDPAQEFELAIQFPVTGVPGPLPEGMEVVDDPAFYCARVVYRGGMERIGDGWMAVMDFLRGRGLAPGRESREVYHRWVDYSSPDNETELQQEVG